MSICQFHKEPQYQVPKDRNKKSRAQKTQCILLKMPGEKGSGVVVKNEDKNPGQLARVHLVTEEHGCPPQTPVTRTAAGKRLGAEVPGLKAAELCFSCQA